MNKYLSTCLKGLKYLGIALLVGYLILVVHTLNEQKDDDISVTERLANAFFGSLYAGVIYISIFIADPTGSKTDPPTNLY